jgi:malate synthase
MSGTRTNRATQLQVDQTLLDFIEQELLPSAGLEASTFWPGLEGLFADFGPQNQELLNERTRLQTLIDRWHSDHPGIDWDADRYEAYLREIGYLARTRKSA